MSPTTLLLLKVLGPLLILRGLSIFIDKDHFTGMLNNLEQEIETVSFSMVPVILFVAFGSLAVTHWRFDSFPATLITLMAVGGTAKTAFLILFPRVGVAKAKQLGRFGFINLVGLMSLGLGLYFAWTGWVQS